MNPRTTAMLAIVALLLGGFVYFYELGGEADRQAALDEEKRVYPGLSADAVDSIGFETKDGQAARFERRDGRWRVVRPVEDRGDASALDAIVSAIASLPRAGDVREPGPLEEYGLGDSARIVRFEVAGEAKEIRIGRSTPVGGHVYVARLDADADTPREVSYVESYRLNPLKRDLDDLRDRRLFGFEAGEVRTLRIEWPSSDGTTQVALAHDEAGDWMMGMPTVDRADQQRVRELLSDLAFLRAHGFVDERTEEVEAALAETYVTLYWTLAGDHIERRARIGGAIGDDRIIETPDGRLYTIESERTEDYALRVDAYRFKMLGEFDLSNARRLSIEFSDEGEGPTRFEATLGEAGWTGPESNLDPHRVSDIVRALSSLRADEILADEMGPAERASLGLAPPRVRIRVDGAELESEAAPLAEVAIGRLDEVRGLFAQRVGEPRIFVLPASLAEDIPTSRSALESGFSIRAEEADEALDDAFEEDFDEDAGADPLEGIEIP